jgi:hypothetical protein
MTLRIIRKQPATGDLRPHDSMYSGIKQGRTVVFHAPSRDGALERSKYTFEVSGSEPADRGRNEPCNVSVRDGHATLL